MTEETANTKSDVSAPVVEEPAVEPAQGDGIDWKAKAREWEKRAKANSDAQKRLDEIENAKKSEVERLTDQAKAAEKERDEAVAQRLRFEVAADAGIPLSAAARLQGSTREELEADAKELAGLLSTQKAAAEKTARDAALTDKSLGRSGDAGPASTADQFAAMFNK